MRTFLVLLGAFAQGCWPSDVQCGATDVYCENGAFLHCVDGAMVTVPCSAACVPSLGCVECDPTAAATSCSGDQVRQCGAAGTMEVIATCAPGHCDADAGACDARDPRCDAPEAQRIYAIDDVNGLWSFDPGTTAFAPVGTLSCPGAGGVPFSLAVDRDLRASVVYSDGKLFHVSLADAGCTATIRTPSTGYEVLLPAFVTDGSSERLFVTGSAADGSGPRGFATMDPASFTISPLGSASSTAEALPPLAGTSTGALFALYPSAMAGGVARLSLTNGAEVQSWPLPSLTGSLVAWGFAHWGGRLYLFETTSAPVSGALTNTVRRLDPATGSVEGVLASTPHSVIAASSSTCAPP